MMTEETEVNKIVIGDDIKVAFIALETAYNNMYSCMVNNSVPMSRYIHPDEKQYAQLQTPTTGHYMLAFLRQELGIKYVLPKSPPEYDHVQQDMLKTTLSQSIDVLKLPTKIVDGLRFSKVDTIEKLCNLGPLEINSKFSPEQVKKIASILFTFGINMDEKWMLL